MKLKLNAPLVVWFGVLVVSGWSASSASAEQTNLVVNARTLNAGSAVEKSDNKKGPVTAAEIIAAPIPPSTFAVPRKRVDGCDPFFPNSDRVYGVDATIKQDRDQKPSVDLVLRGISGTPEQPLAIINTTTFTTGESNEVLHKNGRVKIQVVEINMASGTVLLQMGAERRELRLNGGTSGN